MKLLHHTYSRYLVLLLIMMVAPIGGWGQETIEERTALGPEDSGQLQLSENGHLILDDSTKNVRTDTLTALTAPLDTAKTGLLLTKAEKKQLKAKREHKYFVPDPQRALWLSFVIPGGGQFYNRKYWKLPVFYGGFLGCMYAFTWNQQMYMDYSQAYLDIMDDNPDTNSYLSMFPSSYDIEGNKERFKTVFKNRKDLFRRYRDLSTFCFIGVYLLSVIDAYVDAQLSSFDISDDLTLHWGPATLNSPANPYGNIGFGASLTF